MSDRLNQALIDLGSLLKRLEDRKIEHSANHIEFKNSINDENKDRGLLWTGLGSDKKFVLSNNNSLFSTENINLAKDCSYRINENLVLSDKELGPTVIKSNLKEVGRLRSLEISGNLEINEYLFYNSQTDRLGLGTDEPNAALSVAEDGIEVMIGTEDSVKGKIGTYGNFDLELVTDNTARITLEKSGDIIIGNKNFGNRKTTIVGKLNVGLKNLDTRVDLQVDGPIKFQERIHQYASTVPTIGTYKRGDIIWNDNPVPGNFVGWVCVRDGTPGSWCGFGEIKSN